jgi:hypothetical protein
MRIVYLLIVATFILTACGLTPTTAPTASSDNLGEPANQVKPSEAPSNQVHPTEAPANSPTQETQTPMADGNTQINPRAPTTGEYSFSQLLPLDGIRPVYDPQLVSPSAVQDLLQDDELVLGISIKDEAKAYPISVLRFREMVNDEMAGIPTLVTW